jgi:hypothetical protein
LDLDPYTERYDYWSDSDLEDELEVEGENEFEAGDEEPAEESGCTLSPGPENALDPITVPDYPSPRPSSVGTNEAQNFGRSALCFVNVFRTVGQLQSQI